MRGTFSWVGVCIYSSGLFAYIMVLLRQNLYKTTKDVETPYISRGPNDPTNDGV